MTFHGEGRTRKRTRASRRNTGALHDSLRNRPGGHPARVIGEGAGALPSDYSAEASAIGRPTTSTSRNSGSSSR